MCFGVRRPITATDRARAIGNRIAALCTIGRKPLAAQVSKPRPSARLAVVHHYPGAARLA